MPADTNSEGEGAGPQGENEAKGAGPHKGHEGEGGRRRAASNTSSSRSYGPTNSYGICHYKVTKVLMGHKVSSTIHDNRLVDGWDEGEHNAKYGSEHQETKSYKEVMEPLRRLHIKDATNRMKDSETHLALHEPKRKKYQVTDASQSRMVATLYQKDDQGKWAPGDHTSRAWSEYDVTLA